MPPTSARATQRGRRLFAAVAATAALFAATSTLLGGSTVGRAFNQGSPNANPPAPCNPSRQICVSPAPSSSPTPTPTPTPAPSDCQYFPEFCPSPSPSIVVVTPVTPDPTPTATIPSYLQGFGPSPTQDANGATVISSPVPLGGGFVDQLPTPSQQPRGAAGDLAPHQSGLPLPFLAVGLLLILGAVGSLIYAIAPREKDVFTRAEPRDRTSPVLFTPYGPDTPGSGTNLLTGGQPPRTGGPKP
ncbi:MAG: hypothetical protein ABR598_01110 [Candidatus Dormibacteria bacterium]